MALEHDEWGGYATPYDIPIGRRPIAPVTRNFTTAHQRGSKHEVVTPETFLRNLPDNRGSLRRPGCERTGLPYLDCELGIGTHSFRVNDTHGLASAFQRRDHTNRDSPFGRRHCDPAAAIQ